MRKSLLLVSFVVLCLSAFLAGPLFAGAAPTNGPKKDSDLTPYAGLSKAFKAASKGSSADMAPIGSKKKSSLKSSSKSGKSKKIASRKASASKKSAYKKSASKKKASYKKSAKAKKPYQKKGNKVKTSKKTT